MRAIKVTFENGDTVETSINGTEEEIRDYYLENHFQFGDTEECPQDKMLRAVDVQFID